MNIKEAINHKKMKDKTEYAPIQRTTLTISEVAEYVGISKDFAYKLVRQKEIPHIRIGSRLVFKKGSIDKWLDDLEYEA